MSGCLEREELVEVIQKAGVNMTKEEIDAIVKEIDYTEDGLINYTEFLAATINQEKFLTEDRLQAIFNSFDLEGDGHISVENLKVAFSKFGRDLSKSEIDEIFARHDKDNNKVIDYDEFKAMMTGKQ